MHELEKGIIELEEQIRDDNAALIRASQMGQGKSIASLSLSIHTARKRIEELFEELESVSADHASKSHEFDEKLEEIGKNRQTADPRRIQESTRRARG